jgi:hypothetical protein
MKDESPVLTGSSLLDKVIQNFKAIGWNGWYATTYDET